MVWVSGCVPNPETVAEAVDPDVGRVGPAFSETVWTVVVTDAVERRRWPGLSWPLVCVIHHPGGIRKNLLFRV